MIVDRITLVLAYIYLDNFQSTEGTVDSVLLMKTNKFRGGTKTLAKMSMPELGAYLENIAPQHLYLFNAGETQLRLIGLKIKREDIDLTNKEGFTWLRDNLMSDEVELFNADKSIETDKNMKIFELIKQGSTITKGELFKYFDDLIG